MVADNVVLFTADCARFDFEHEIVLRKPLKQLGGNVEILLQRQIAAIEHVPGEKIGPARSAALFGFRDEREDEFVELVFEAMVRVQRNINRVTFRHSVHVLRDRDRTERRIFQRSA